MWRRSKFRRKWLQIMWLRNSVLLSIRHPHSISPSLDGITHIFHEIFNLDLFRGRKGVFRAINNFIDSFPVTDVLGVKHELPRETIVTLAQLCSRYCNRLNFYLSRIYSDILNLCPICKKSPRDVNHLFACSAKSSHLTRFSLRSDPVEKALFLYLPLYGSDDNLHSPPSRV